MLNFSMNISIYSEHCGLTKIFSNHKYAFINTNNELICDYIYDYASDFKDGYAKVKLNNKFGFIDTSGNEIIPCLYDTYIESKLNLIKYIRTLKIYNFLK
jgi:hypothetical protein